MTSPVFFSTGAAPVSGGSRNLVEFKAGKMEMRNKMVHPIDKKGLVYLRQSQEDNLMHFCWKDRSSGVVEDDLILIPDDCEFKRVKECTTGRVYVLKMKSANKRLFFWMQEPQTETDEDYCKKINDMLNNPPRGSDAGGSSTERDLQTLLSGMSQEQVAQLLTQNGLSLSSFLQATNAIRSPSSNSGGSGSSAASTSVSNFASQPLPAGASESQKEMHNLRHLLSEALMEGTNEEEADALVASSLDRAVQQRGSTSQQRNEDQLPVMIDLSHVINSESLAQLLEDAEFVRQIESHLPPISQGGSAGEGVKKQAADTIRSSQFRSSLSQFCTALQSGQLGPLMSQFGLNQACVEAASLGNLEAFVRALESQMSSTSGASSVASSESANPDPSASSQSKQSSDQSKDKK